MTLSRQEKDTDCFGVTKTGSEWFKIKTDWEYDKNSSYWWKLFQKTDINWSKQLEKRIKTNKTGSSRHKTGLK